MNPWGYSYSQHRSHSRWDIVRIPAEDPWPCSVKDCGTNAIAFFHYEPWCVDHLGPAWAEWVMAHEELREDGLPVDGHSGQGRIQKPGAPQLPDDAFSGLRSFKDWGMP